jgi:hypothetical protein
MDNYIPFESGVILRSEWKKHGLNYIFKGYNNKPLPYHVPTIILADCHLPFASRSVYYFKTLVDFLTAMGRKPRQGAGSLHELGYYKQGVN